MSKNGRTQMENLGSKRATKLLFIILLSVVIIFVLGMIEVQVRGAQFNITLDSPSLEYESEFTALLVANCTDELGVNHMDNVTFKVDGIEFKYSNYTGLYYGTASQNTPTIIEYDSLTEFTDTENGTSAGQITQTVTITWTTGTVDRLIVKFMEGNWIGAIFDELSYVVGSLTFYTFILGMFSIAMWNVAGPYGTFLSWILGWAVFAPRMHGAAQVGALIMFALGVGILFTKLYLDRRTS
ncbi:unnamed protein product [marine sediment metagenome]|uniref:Uncharacterized protein n=1 Tax=marine sediment metagenome TaxID=412755 RepID=X0ZRS3_9ZZZZ